MAHRPPVNMSDEEMHRNVALQVAFIHHHEFNAPMPDMSIERRKGTVTALVREGLLDSSYRITTAGIAAWWKHIWYHGQCVSHEKSTPAIIKHYREDGTRIQEG